MPVPDGGADAAANGSTVTPPADEVGRRDLADDAIQRDLSRHEASMAGFTTEERQSFHRLALDCLIAQLPQPDPDRCSACTTPVSSEPPEADAHKADATERRQPPTANFSCPSPHSFPWRQPVWNQYRVMSSVAESEPIHD